jgi:hypothetical protein
VDGVSDPILEQAKGGMACTPDDMPTLDFSLVSVLATIILMES